MLPGLALVVACAACALLPTTAQAAKKPAKSARCAPAGSTPVAASSAVSVYARGRSVVACRNRSGRTLRLGAAGLPDDERRAVTDVTVRGVYVGFVTRQSAASSQGPYPPDELRVIDASTFRALDLGPRGCEPAKVDGYLGHVIRSYAITAAGQVAWSCYGGSYAGSLSEIHRRDGSGVAVLDSRDERGTDPIELDSVAIAGQRVYWSTAAGAHSAPLR